MRTLALTIAFLALLGPVEGFPACNECHSKNPKMVRMHKALGYKDCFACHGPVSKRTMKDVKAEMASDGLCKGCHGTKDKPSQPRSDTLPRVEGGRAGAVRVF